MGAGAESVRDLPGSAEGREAALYPSYVDLDPFIDVARLRALDRDLRKRLQQRVDRERCTMRGPGTASASGCSRKGPV